MDEQLLKDLVATSEAYDYDWETILPKFPELSNYDTQLLKDYVATTEANNYDYNLVNSKFPEFNFTKVDTEPTNLSEAIAQYKRDQEIQQELNPSTTTFEEDMQSQLDQSVGEDNGLVKMEEKEFDDWSKALASAEKERVRKDKELINNTLAGYEISEQGDTTFTEPINLAANQSFNNPQLVLDKLTEIGFEQREENRFDDQVWDLEAAAQQGDIEAQGYLPLAQQALNREINNYIQTAILNEDGKTPRAAEIFRVYNEQQQELAKAKSETTIMDEVELEGNSVDDEDFYKKVNDKTNEGLRERSFESMETQYGKEAVDKIRNAKTKEEATEALRELRNDPNVNIYYDPATGEAVNKSFLSDEEIEQQDKKFDEMVEKFSFMPVNEQVQALYQLENKVAAMANSLVGANETGTPTLLQALGVNWNDDKDTDQDVLDMEQMASTGIVPANVSTLPNGGNMLGGVPNAAVKKYNNLVENLNTARTVVGLNMDPTTAQRVTSPIGFIPFTEFDNKLLGSAYAAIPDAFNLESLSTNEMANRFVYDIMTDELGKTANKEIQEKVGDRGDYYVGAAENIGSTITPLAKMGGEILLWTAMSGGTGGVAKGTYALGRLTATNLAKLGLNPRTSLKVGEFTQGVLAESWGLIGSNTIGGITTNSEGMPVVPFALGSQLGHLGINYMGKTIPTAIAKYAEKNPSFARVVNIIDKAPGTHAVGGAVKFGTRPALGATAIKGGELTSGLLDVAQGETTFDELMHHVTDGESFMDMYGALMFMGMARPGKAVRAVVENANTGILKLRGRYDQWNILAQKMGLPSKSKGESWSKEEIEEAKLKKLNAINKNNKLDARQKQQAREDVEFNAGKLGVKRAMDQIDVSMKNYDNWNVLSTKLNATMKMLESSRELTPEGMTHIADAGIANGGTVPILALQGIGYSPKAASDLYKSIVKAQGEATAIFPDATSKPYKRYMKNVLSQGENSFAKTNLKKQYEAGEISEGLYNVENRKLEEANEALVKESEILIEEAELARQGRVAETMKQAEKVLKNPEGQVKELNSSEFYKTKEKLGGNTESTGFGFQTVIEGKPTFFVNKDAMKTYGKGSTLKHELYHPVFERKFSTQAIAKRASEISKKEKISEEDALFKANQEAYDYLDSFYGRLKEVGVFERVEKEMMEVPGYKELKKSGKRNLKIEKEFINEYLELQNEGSLNSLLQGVKAKEIGAEALDLNSGADVVDYFIKNIEKTEAGTEALKKAQLEYEKLNNNPTIQASSRLGRDIKTTEAMIEKYANNPDGSRMTKKQWDSGGSDKAIKEIPQLLVGSIAGKVRGSYFIPKDSNVKIPKDEFTKDMLVRLGKKLEKGDKARDLEKKIKEFNPEINDNISGYVASIINFAKMDLFKEYEQRFSGQRSLDTKYEGGRDVFEMESKELNPEEAMIAKQEGESSTKNTNKKINPLTDYKNISEYKGKKPLEDFVDITPADVSIDRVGGQKGLQSKYGNRVAAELFFGEPGKELSTEIKKGEKISELDKAMGKLTDIAHKDGKPVMIEKKYKNGKIGMVPKPYSQNLTYAKKFKDGIPEPSEAGRIQEVFSNTETAKKFLQLLHRNTASEAADITYVKEGREVNERPDVSADVKGTSVGVNNKLIKLLMDPVMKTGRDGKLKQADSPGLTSQTPMYKAKPELKNPSDAMIRKFQEALGITKAGELNKYDRNIGQTLKGVAKLQGGQAVNTIYRNKIKAFDKAGTLKSSMPVNKILADYKSGVKDIQEASRIKKIGDRYKERQKNAGVKHIEDLIGTKELVPRVREVVVGTAPKYFGNALTKLLGTNVWANSGVNVGKAFRDGMPLISGIDSIILKRAKQQAKKNLKERGVESPTEAQMKRETDKLVKRISEGQDIELSRLAVAEGLTMEQPQLVKEVLEVINNTPELANKFSKKQLAKIDLAIKPQEASKLKKNIENKDDFLEGKGLLLDAYKELLSSHPDAIDIMTQLLYHKNSNTHVLRNLATYLGTELGLKGRGYEEHTLPFGEATLLILDAMSSKTTDWPGFKKWLNENYFQEGISSSPNAKNGDVYGYSQNILDHPMRSTGKGGEVLPVWKSKDQMHPELRRQVDEALAGKRKWDDVISADIRKYNEYSSDRGYINPNKMNRFDFDTGKNRTDAQRYNVEVPKKLENNPNIVEIQNHLIHQQLIGKMSAKQAKEMIDLAIKNAPARLKATRADYKMLSESPVLNLSEKMSTNDLVKKSNTIDKALANARKIKKEPKKIRVFDFDDTVGTSNNKVKATKDGEVKILNAEEFAKNGLDLIDKGWDMDFSDFNKVTEGGKGPLFDLMKTMNEAKGERDIFILTARAPEAAPAIHEFLRQMGIDIPLENITGLGNSTGKAKADWLVDKAAEGYNDFYFADDAPQNVKAVRDALEVLDIKSQVQQAVMNSSERLSNDFNKIIEESTGIGAEKVFSDVKAQVRGARAKRQRFFIPPSAEDMLGLVYNTLGKGKKGEAHLKFYQDNLFDPYNKAMENLSTDRVNLMADFKALKKELDVPADLRKTTESGFTNEQAVRVHLWNKAGEKIPGLSKTDLKELNDIVENNPKLKAFADQIMSITKGDGYSTPKDSWAVGTITTDLIDVLNTKKRSKYLENWKQNKNLIYSKENLNKLEAAYGPKYRSAVENSLRRMESGSNRLGGGNQLSNKVLDYINNSTGAIMFFNTRSAVLQTISAANFINWSFNNPLRAGKAFANQPQYWKDFVELINSDYLKDRRNGLKLNISESEIANAAKTSGNKAKAALNYILEKGYLPTKYADSFAIASGGATFYRNRINDLIKNEGKTEAEAKEIAMLEFRKISETSQQSSDPSKISQQQSSDLGRIVLQFANTPMQYARIQKRAFQDIVNKRGDLKTNISKIAYYGFLQNMLFNGLQQAITSLGFGDDDMTEAEEKKLYKTVNGMLDSSLRGLGMAGVTVQVLKNLGIDVYDRSKRKRPEYSDSYKKLLDFSPSVKSKLGKFQSAAYPFDSKKRREEVFEKGFSLDNPAYESMAKVITGTTNLPLDRLYTKVNNLSSAMDQDNETWQSVAMVLGWPEWQIKPDKKDDKDKEKVKTGPRIRAPRVRKPR